jgi:hypothetical protein
MKLMSTLVDGRINATNLLVEVSAREYLTIAKQILANNEFQRRRVKSSPTLYSLLKEDLLRGCVLPPIVLAFGGDGSTQITPGSEVNFIETHGQELLILDGLQRTSSMLELEADLQAKNDTNSLAKLYAHTLRLEIYVGINRLGVLYRMLTLNTGQTPMSLRQQVEILYLDYIKVPIGNIRLIREVEESAIDELGKYSFKAVIDGFNSYLERNELPIDRYDLLESVKSLEKLSKENEQANLFKDFIETYHLFVAKFNELSKGSIYTSEELQISGQPFGIDARRIFSKEQAMAGFGAAIAKLRDFEKVTSFEAVKESITNLTTSTPAAEALASLLRRLEVIRLSSKKIGNSQRLYFHFYFRELFNPESDAYRDLSAAVEAAYRKYESQML